jgi:PAS domain S-box-containing protein
MTEPSRYVLEMLRDEQEFVLYRGRQPGHLSRVLFLAPVGEQPTPASLKRLEHEYSLAAELDSAWAAKPLALTRNQGRLMLLLEDMGGEPLDRALGRPLEIARFLRIAVGLTAALGKVHQRGLIHKDIKPANVLVDAAGTVRLTGFGIASRLPRERLPPAPPEVIAGTLAYMAPEQTGHMNRSIDARSDLYSLGVTLYEMLTGHLPFVATDPMEWLHCHIARQPVAPGERFKNVPGAVSEIIMKLLAKTAEERYQTAAGAESDLRRCLAEWETQGRIDKFPVGEHDTPDRLLVPEKLYGRTHEIDTLLASFDRVVACGTPELVLVSGFSGIGKSSVVNELHKVLVPLRGLFASGKFDQYKRDIPYATLAQAFQSLIRLLLSKSEAELRNWRDDLHAALGPNGLLIVDLVPELKLIIGEQPPVPDLPPQAAQGRFQLVFRRFISVFARPEHPLALFLDDLQWLDAATLDLLEDLLTRSDVQHLMLIGAYRDNEVNSAHPLMRKLEAIRQAGAIVQEIILAPLAYEDLGHLIADSIHCEPQRVTPLAQLVHEKTAGNPFFAIQFIYALAEEGLLIFDHGHGRWSWDLNRIHAKGYTDNVVDLMVGKLNRLPFETQKALQQLACMGNSAEFALLAMVSQDSKEEMHGDLWEAIRTGLVFRSEGAYRFLHDRVQEAAYSLIPEESRAEAHLRIGRLLNSHTLPEKRDEAIFEIVNQMNRGATLITSREEREQLAELNLVAGKRAKASTAYASALKYLVAGETLLTDDCWQRRHELTFALELNRAECEFLTGALSEAEQRLTALSARAATMVERASVTCLRADLYTTLDQGSRAIAVGLDYLRHLGIDWSPHPTEDEAGREYERIWSQLGSRAIERLIDLPLMSDPVSLATLDVLSKMATPALYTDANLYLLVICRQVNLSLEHGNCDASCFAYEWLAMVAGARFGDYQAAYSFGRLGYDLVEQRGLKRFRARTYLIFGGLIIPWTRHVKSGRDLLRRSFEAANEIGDLTYAAYSFDQLNTNMLAAGDSLVEAQREFENGLEFARKVRFGLVIDLISAELGLVRTLRGLTRKFGSFDDEHFDEREIERRFASNPDLALAECWYSIRKLQARYFAGDYAAALKAVSTAQRLLWTSVSRFETAEYHFYGALSHAAYCDSAAGEQRRQHIEAVAAHYSQLEVWAANCRDNFENRAALVGAEIARIEGHDVEAMRLYEQAIRSARVNGFIHNEALAYELAARFYAARGFEKIAHAYLQDARYGYLRWGADGKVRQLDLLYPHLMEGEPVAGPTSTIGASIEHLDLATMIKVSQAVSGEIVLEKLIDTLMCTAIEHAGAERGLLILPRGDELRIEAEATTARDAVKVLLPQTVVTPGDLPESLLHYVLRTRERVLLDDASVPNEFSADEYISQHHSRSVLCLPLVKQAKLIAVLYLENNLTPRVFTPARVAVLDLLASQAAISLENARLYADLQQENSERKLAENKLRRSQAFLAQAQGLSNTGSFGWRVSTGEIFWSEETFRIFQYDRKTKPTLEHVLQRVHPEDAALVKQTADRAMQGAKGFDLEYRLLVPDGSVKSLYVKARASGENGDPDNVEFFGSVMDITERKQRESLLRESEQRFKAIFSEAGTGISLVELAPDMRIQSNRALQTMLGCSAEELSHIETYDELTRGEERESDAIHFRELRDGKRDLLRQEKHFILRNGKSVWANVIFTLLRDAQGRPKYVIAMHEDITERKQAEELARQEERELRQLVDFVPHLIGVHDREGRVVHVNRAGLEYLGLTLDEFVKSANPRASIYHEEDLGAVRETLWRGLSQGTAGEVEARMRRYDGQYRWFLIRYEPFRNEQGRVIRWYGTATDIEDRKQLEQRMIEENLALREEIDKASMFEEIVGTSDALKAVLVQVSKVAPTDSTVLITGETGTGKELIARAIHKRSKRSARAFVSVNCAAIPPSLIASELFGHEKGAFTGANQRRIGRFELADRGTIFLDEIGDLPLDTQLALLRVLQEREFERVGGTRSIGVDVRVITATNRDLEAAMADGEFRSDLFYRLNVFPIDVPPLRARREDIPLLVEYFIDRFATKAGKDIRQINKRTVELLQSYSWPGNIRELQNVVERSVIVSEGESFSVEENWLSRETVQAELPSRPLVKISAAQEKETIEDALAATRGRVSGRWGAAVMLGIPASTLESKIKALKIDKNRYKTSPQKS